MFWFKRDPAQRLAQGRLKRSLLIAVIGATSTMISRYVVEVYVLQHNHWSTDQKIGYVWGIILTLGVFIYAVRLDTNAGWVKRKDDHEIS